MADARADSTRETWLATLDKFRHDRDRAANAEMWSPRLDAASRDELTAIQNEKLRAAVPFLYENSPFYRRRLDRLGLLPSDLRSVDDLAKWPVVDKTEMMADAAEHPPYGTYTTTTEDIWAKRGWMMFSSSGSTGPPRVFRYTHVDREAWAWANARAMYAMGFRRGDTVFMMTGYGPHVWAWGVQYALEKMELPTIPGGGMDARARANTILRFKPTVLLCTPSYALHLGRLMQSMGHDPAATSVRTLFVAGEPALAIEATRAPHRGSVERAHRRILRLHRGLAACRRLFLLGADSQDLPRGNASDGRHPDLGDRRSGNPARRAGGAARADRLHQSEFGKLAATALPGRRLHHAQHRAAAPAAAPMCVPWVRSPAAPTI